MDRKRIGYLEQNFFAEKGKFLVLWVLQSQEKFSVYRSMIVFTHLISHSEYQNVIKFLLKFLFFILPQFNLMYNSGHKSREHLIFFKHS
jgi:hypothetical protein